MLKPIEVANLYSIEKLLNLTHPHSALPFRRKEVADITITFLCIWRHYIKTCCETRHLVQLNFQKVHLILFFYVKWDLPMTDPSLILLMRHAQPPISMIRTGSSVSCPTYTRFIESPGSYTYQTSGSTTACVHRLSVTRLASPRCSPLGQPCCWQVPGWRWESGSLPSGW